MHDRDDDSHIDAMWVRTGGVQTNVRKRVTIDDVNSINERASHVLAVEPQQDKDLQLQWGNKNASLKIVGATANFVQVQHFVLDRGRVFTSGEDIGRQRVAVLGAGALTLLGVRDPDAIIGERVCIGGMQFEVIGTLMPKGAGAGFGSLDDLFALVTSEADLTVATTEISLALRRSHRSLEGQPSRSERARSGSGRRSVRRVRISSSSSRSKR